MKVLNIIVRILLGISLLIFGLNKAIHFLPMPPMEGEKAQFMMALASSEYIFKIVMVMEILTGIALLVNRFVPLFLIMFVPITVNIIGFHLSFDIAGIGGAAVVTILHVYLLFVNLDHFKGFLKFKTN
ncbi:MAG: DoxX protein [Bacteroidetes bacterium]|nr:DoxX protein [Bacteroidota bacterium]